MKKIYHINQKKPFMIFNQYKLKIIGGKNRFNRKVTKMFRNERS